MLTARLLSVLELTVSGENFVDGVPAGCAQTYEEIMENLWNCMANRGAGRPVRHPHRRAGDTEPPSTDTSGESEGEELHGGDGDEDLRWPDGDAEEN